MFGKESADADGLRERRGPESSYPLSWPASHRWNPHYNVPRNSVDSAWVSPDLETGTEAVSSPGQHRDTARSASYVNARRDADTRAAAIAGANRRSWNAPGRDDKQEEFSDLTHWLETLAELYMNDIDNRARWDPRWLNLTRRERFEGLDSATITILDYLRDNSVQQTGPLSSKNQLAQKLQNRPEEAEVRVLLVSDLSRFVMGVLGQLYSVDPEFWYDHLANSGYAGSDSGLKLKNAVWLNWAEREIRMRHHPLPGTGQRTEWNVPRRTRDRCWAHMRWGRLGLLHYLGRKGFYEQEIHQRLGDGRYLVERDVLLDKRGLLLTKRRRELAERAQRKKQKKKRHQKTSEGAGPRTQNNSHEQPAQNLDGISRRSKTSNVYRAYSTFEGLPKNPKFWTNRDLRVMAPEGASHWSGLDALGRRTVIILVDPPRSMKHEGTGQLTPSLTFMPRALEIEAHTDEETWRSAEPDETYLDPPPAPLSMDAVRERKRESQKRQMKEKGQRLRRRLESIQDKDNKTTEEDKSADDTDSSTESSDSEYSEEYEENLRAEYAEPRAYTRDRDFARKYALSTHDLLCRYMTKVTTAELVTEVSTISSILFKVVMDDMWQVLAEMRLDLNHLDGEFGAGLLRQLVEVYGNKVLQNMNWARSTLQELDEWARHLAKTCDVLRCPEDLVEELAELRADVAELRSRTDSSVNLLSASMAIAQSTQIIDQTSGINKLTELAFVFVPISFITAVFSMQVRELTESSPPIWVWGVALTSIVVVTYLVRSVIRSPSFRMVTMRMRATVISRYSSPDEATAAKQFGLVSTRALIKYVCITTSATLSVLLVAFLTTVAYTMALYGIWIGTVATAIYFIVTKWPTLAVIIPCFLSLPLSLLGWRLADFWSKEITELGEWVLGSYIAWVEAAVPTKDQVEDDDLAMEGVKTYARQALVLIT